MLLVLVSCLIIFVSTTAVDVGPKCKDSVNGVMVCQDLSAVLHNGVCEPIGEHIHTVHFPSIDDCDQLSTMSNTDYRCALILQIATCVSEALYTHNTTENGVIDWKWIKTPHYQITTIVAVLITVYFVTIIGATVFMNRRRLNGPNIFFYPITYMHGDQNDRHIWSGTDSDIGGSSHHTV